MKKLFYLFMMSLMVGQLQAQYIWYFGNSGGLQFSGTFPPAPHSGSFMSTAEGSTVVTDNVGAVMFYSDGTYLWDGANNFVTIPGGAGHLLGSSSATHAAIAIPIPGSDCQKFLLFTTKGYDNAPIDTCPLGVCLVTTTNALAPYAITAGTAERVVIAGNSVNYSEKLAVTDDGSGGFWLLAHDWNKDSIAFPGRTFYTFHITQTSFNGVTTTAQAVLVLQSIVMIQTNPIWENQSGRPQFNYSNSQGQMKFDKQGNTLGLVICWKKVWENYAFNKATGILTRQINVKLPFLTTGTLYGCEFSPDGSLFYTSEEVVWPPIPTSLNREIKQWDVTGGTLNGLYSIPGTQYSGTNHGWYQLQLGPDDRIYCAGPTMPRVAISVIPNPNIVAGCGFQKDIVPLSPGMQAMAGLPTLIKNINGCNVVVENEVPTLSQWGLIVLGIVLFCVGAIYINIITCKEIPV
jgi:hypothetical protein